MAAAPHPAAPHHLPAFITAPGETDIFMVVSLVMLLLIVFGIGVFYLRLHALPERMAHKGEKVQFQFVAVLSLIALFTHNHIYWIAALLLAYVRLPDFGTPLAGMDNSLARIADAKMPRRAARPEARAKAAPAAKPKPDEAGDA